MKKLFSAIAIFTVIFCPLLALADGDILPPPQTISNIAQIPETNVENTINSLTNWFFAIFLIVAVWFLILAGFNFVTANGDSEKIKKARTNLMWSFVGILVAVLAKGIVSLAFGLARQ